jgi:BspA type Leucine rich repeat region (6 copies)
MDSVIYLSNSSDPIVLQDITNITSYNILNKQKYITNILIGSSITSLDRSCFENCYNIKTITIPANIKNIYDRCFALCYNLTKIIISQGVQMIGNECFLGCFNLRQIALPATIESIGSNCFQGCNNLDTIFIEKQKNLKYCGNDLFKYINKPIKMVFNRTPSADYLSYFALELIKQNNVANYSFASEYTYDNEHNFNIFNNSDTNIIPIKNKNRDATFTNLDSYNSTIADSDIITTFRVSGDIDVDPSKLRIVGRTIYQSAFNDYLTSKYYQRVYRCDIAYGVTTIGDNAFGLIQTGPPLQTYSQYSLEYIIIPNTVISIGKMAFSFSGLKSIEIPDSVRLIGNACFTDCYNLNTIKLGNNISILPQECFKNCNACISIIIPDSVKQISDNCFSGCTSLQHVFIGTNVEYIGSGCFENCTNLKQIIFNSIDSLNGIGTNIFNNINSQINFIFPDDVNALQNTFVAQLVGQNTNAIVVKTTSILNTSSQFTYSDNKVTITNESKIDNTLINLQKSLVSMNISPTVNYIAPGIFHNNTTLESVNFIESINNNSLLQLLIHDLSAVILNIANLNNSISSNTRDVQMISTDNFRDATNIIDTSILSDYVVTGSNNTNNSLMYFGNGFFNCTNLRTVSLPNNIDGLPMDCFNNCLNLETIILDTYNSQIKYFENGCFNNCVKLETINIPVGITFIGSYCFSNCNKLTYITIPNKISFISKGTFFLCKSLMNIDILENVEHICAYAFGGCLSLTNVTLPTSINIIDIGVFSNCTNLHTVSCPKLYNPNGFYYITRISENAFENCSSLQVVEGTSKVNYIGYKAFSGCTNLYNALFEDENLSSIEYIGEYAFMNCARLTNITIVSKTLTEIGTGCFYGCNQLNAFDANSNTFDIPNMCFQSCTALTSVSISSQIIGDYAFNGCSSITYAYLNSPTEIGVGCFSECSKLEYIELNTAIQFFPEGCFNRCYSLASVAHGTWQLTKIGTFCFSGCSSLTLYTITAQVTSLGAWCFSLAPPKYTANDLFTPDLDYLAIHPFTTKTLIFENPNYITQIDFDNKYITTIFDDINVTNITIIFKNCSGIASLNSIIRGNIVNIYNKITYKYEP